MMLVMKKCILFTKEHQNFLLENQKLQIEELFRMANDKSREQFLNFINAWNKRKHDNYELDDIEDTIFFPHYVLMTKQKKKLCL